MISVNDLRTGLTIQVEGEVYSVVEFLHVKPGKGAAFVRTKLKNVKTGAVREMTFRAGERVERAIVETKQMQFLYEADGEYFFMDTNDYNHISLRRDDLGDAPRYLLENMVIGIQFFEGSPIGVDLPTTVNLKVIETEPGFRGDTPQARQSRPNWKPVSQCRCRCLLNRRSNQGRYQNWRISLQSIR